MATNFIALMIAAVLALHPHTAQSQEIQSRTIRFGHGNHMDHPISLGARRFAELLAVKSGGKLLVQEYPAYQLGNELQQQSALQEGLQEMTVHATTLVVGAVKEFGLLDFPFSVNTFAQADALLDGPLGQALMAKLPEKGLVALGYWDLGFRNITNNKRPITRLEDLRGLNIRVIPNQVFVETFKALKANPVPMPFSELHAAIQSGTVDGQENPFAVILSNKTYALQKHLSVTNHVYAANIVLVSKRFWDKLSPTEKKLMADAAKESTAYQRQVSRASARNAMADLQAKGMIFNDLPPAELEQMRKTVRPVTKHIAATYDPSIVKLYNDELARIRGL